MASALSSIFRSAGDSVRLGPLRAEKSNERARERHRRAAYTAAASILARAIGLAASLVTIRLTLAYLGTERFGLWMTISSLQMFFAFADLGVGNGLLTAVAEASGKDETRTLREYIDSGVLLLGSISVVVLAGLASTYHLFQFGHFFNLHSSQAMSEVGPALAIFVVCFAIDIPVGLVHRVQCGLQLGFLSNLWQIAGSIMAFAGVLLVIDFRASLPMLVLAYCGAPLLAKMLNACVFFGRMQPELLPTFQLVSWSATRKIGTLAFLFFVLQAAVALAYQSDNLIITHVLGPESVTQYSVPQKLFTLISVAIATIIGPLWPAYGEAISRGDGAWVKRTLTRTLIGAVALAALMSATLFVAAPTLIHIWVGNKVHASLLLLAGFACWAVVEAGGNAIAMFLNGAAVMKPQVIIAGVFAVCALVAKVTFVRHWGIAAMPWATLLCYLALTALPYAFLVPKVTSVVCSRESAEALQETSESTLRVT